jgi:hypothetical protein
MRLHWTRFLNRLGCDRRHDFVSSGKLYQAGSVTVAYTLRSCSVACWPPRPFSYSVALMLSAAMLAAIR